MSQDMRELQANSPIRDFFEKNKPTFDKEALFRTLDPRNTERPAETVDAPSNSN